MRVMMIMKATPASEAGELPGERLLAAMGAYNQQLVEAGVLLAGEGLQPSSRGARVRFGSGAPEIIDGPFTETKELLAGYWLWQVKSMDEAIEWLKRAPFDGTTLEIRPIFEMEDFANEMTPEAEAIHNRVRSTLESQQA